VGVAKATEDSGVKEANGGVTPRPTGMEISDQSRVVADLAKPERRKYTRCSRSGPSSTDEFDSNDIP
jgi:hypothetical protein